MRKSTCLGSLSVPTMSPLLVVLLLFINISASCATSNSANDAFIKCLSGQTKKADQVSKIVFTQSNPSYTSVLRAYIRNARFNYSTTPKPVIIVTPTNESHVQAAVICAKQNGIQLRIRSGGHDYAGVSYVSNVPFVILDMFNLRTITINVKEETAWVQAGATLGELYYKIWQNSKVLGFPAGVCPTVGIGGHLSGAGYGNMVRKYGLSVDHVIDAQIVDVNGKILNKASMGEDLFWAIKGGGGASFGVVLSYTIKLVPVPPTVTVFRAERTLEQNGTNIVYRWQQVAPTTDENLFMRMLIQPVTSKVTKGARTIRASIVAEFLGSAQDLLTLLGKEFPELGLKKEDVLEMSWIDSVLWWNDLDKSSPDVLLDRNPDTAKFGRRKSDYVVTPISKDGLESIWKNMINGKVGFVFNPYGGQMNEVPASETPFPHRAGNLFKMQYSVSWDEPGPVAENNFTTQMRKLHDFMTPFVSKNPRRSYLNYRDLDIGINHNGKNIYQEGKVYGTKYFNANFDRLVKVKTAVDPQNFFTYEQSIPPLTTKG